MMQEFDEIEAQKGLVEVLAPIVGQYLANLMYRDSSGTLQDSGQPAIYLGYPNEIEPSNPKIHITFNGDTNTSTGSFESGIAEIDDPNNPGTLIEVPYESSYLTYVLTLTCDSGPKDIVNRGERKSSSWILRKFRESLKLHTVRNEIHTYMKSSIMTISNVSPVYDIVETSYHDSANMSLTFDTISTVYDLGGSYIQTINYESTYKRCLEGDTDPIIITGSVTST